MQKMTSDILSNLRTLSDKVDKIQTDILQLYQIVADHLCAGQGQTSHGHDLTQHKSCCSNECPYQGFDSQSQCISQQISYSENEYMNPTGRQEICTCQGHTFQGHELSNQRSNCLHKCMNPVGRNKRIINGAQCSMKCQETLSEQTKGFLESPKQTDTRSSSHNEETCLQSSNLTKKPYTPERPKSYRYRNSKVCKEACMRKALQQNIVLLVDNLPHSENDIIDILVENECLTEAECSDLLSTGSRKDRVRNLVRVIKGRSYKVMKTFVDSIQKLHPEVAASVHQVFEKLMKEKKDYRKQCTFCVLKRSTDLKFIADHIWSIGAISDVLFDEIADGVTDKETLWTKLADECNKSKVCQTACRKISESLLKKGHCRDLVLKLSKLTVFGCACFKVNRDLMSLPAPESTRVPHIVFVDSAASTVSPLSTPASSRSPAEENEIASDDENLPVNRHENYLLSPRTSENYRFLYTSHFGIRKCCPNTLSIDHVEFRSIRSNSFERRRFSSNDNLQIHTRRRASMFM